MTMNLNTTSDVAADRATKMLTEVNHNLEELLLNKQIQPLIDFYDQHAVVFAEYKSAMTEQTTIEHFYTDWLSLVDISAFKKIIYEVQVFRGYLLEVGTIHLSYSHTINKAEETIYHGKYMVFWQQGNEGQWRILSEIFGSETYLTPEEVPYAKVTIKECEMSENLNVDPELWSRVNNLNEQVIKDVEAGDGDKRSRDFTDDGIYMPHFERMLVGIEQIRPYMLKTYKPENAVYVKHRYYKIVDLQTHMLVLGHFDGGWKNSESSGTFQGNMFNLRKRDEQGKWLMHRQMSVNDRGISVN